MPKKETVGTSRLLRDKIIQYFLLNYSISCSCINMGYLFQWNIFICCLLFRDCRNWFFCLLVHFKQYNGIDYPFYSLPI